MRHCSRVKRCRTEITPITDKVGPVSICHLEQDAWTTKAIDRRSLERRVPAFSVLWLGEPDLTEHETAPGAPAALAAIKSADENLAAVLAALDERKARGKTDVFIVSDHGFSTIKRSIDLRRILNDSGFTAKIEELRIADCNQSAGGIRDKTEFNGQPKPGDIMLAANGGSVLFYVAGHDETLHASPRRILAAIGFRRSDFHETTDGRDVRSGASEHPKRSGARRRDGVSLGAFQKSVRRPGYDRRRLATGGRKGDARRTQSFRHA